MCSSCSALQLHQPPPAPPGSAQDKTQTCHSTLCEFYVLFNDFKECQLNLLCKSLFLRHGLLMVKAVSSWPVSVGAKEKHNWAERCPRWGKSQKQIQKISPVGVMFCRGREEQVRVSLSWRSSLKLCPFCNIPIKCTAAQIEFLQL